MIELEGEWKADDEAEDEDPSGEAMMMPWVFLLLFLRRLLLKCIREGDTGAEDVGDGESPTKVSFRPE